MADAAADPIAPHPELANYYGESQNKSAFLRDIFDQTAPDYDRVERVLALGSGRWYRRQALKRAGLVDGMRVLDVATGTGLVAREAIEIVGPAGRVIGVDPSAGMLDQTRSLSSLQAVLGRGEFLPVADNAFDFVSMGYALRHLPDLKRAFAEFFRVLKPGGRLCILEISRPPGFVRRQLLHAYFRGVLPVASWCMRTSPQTRKLWQYYWETIDGCVAPEIVLAALREAGFENAKRGLSLGLFSEFTGTKMSDAENC